MIKWLWVCFYLLPLITVGQDIQLPIVSFNHLYVVLRNEDLKAIQQSEFIKNVLGALETRTSKGSNETWTGTYLYSVNNYIELFDTASLSGSTQGTTGIGFSVDKLNDLKLLQVSLAKNYVVETFEQEKEEGTAKFAWYHGLYFDDSLFYEKSALSFWMMAYDTACFNYYHFPYQEDLLTQTAYLKKFDADREGKIIRSFTGAVLHLTNYEMDYFSKYLLQIGFTQSGPADFVSANKQFTFTLKQRADEDSLVVSALIFEANYSGKKKTIAISPNVSVMVNKKNGSLNFR
ncbi:MAG: DUF5829 family protein [Chitinophagales bacterium]